MIDIRKVDPTEPGLEPLFEAHLALMRSSSPACSVHAMEPADLKTQEVDFFAAFKRDEPVAMGALKRISGTHGELKSMHVRRDHRGTSLANLLLAHLLDAARSGGFQRLSLETGSQEAFAPARAFYGRNGFNTCPPFEGYGPDPNSVFMTRKL